MSESTTHEFTDLLDALCERGLSSTDLARLESLAANDPARRAAIVELLQLDAALRFESSAASHTRLVASTKPDLSTTKVRMQSKIENRESKIFFSLAAALLFSAAAVAVYVFAFSNPQSDIPTPKSEAPLATLIESTQVVSVDDDIAVEGQEYGAGVYAIESGSAQFLLTNRVTVDLRGKTQLTMYGEMSATLTRGVAAFVCPPEAKGFTVHLPGGSRVVDLGTAFVVTVSSDGESSVRVTEGSVHFTAPGNSNPHALAIGDLIRCAGDRVIVNDADLALAEPKRVVNVDFGPGGPPSHRGGVYTGSGVAAPSGKHWNVVDSAWADGLRAADGATDTPVTIAATNVNRGQRPGQTVGIFDDYAFNHTDQGPWTIELAGLDDTQTYDLVLYAATAIDQGTGFTIDGVERSTLGNRTDAMIDGVSYVRFTAVKPTDGRIEVRVSSPGLVDRTGYFCNGLQLVASRGFAADASPASTTAAQPHDLPNRSASQ